MENGLCLVLLRENGNCIFGSSLLLMLMLELDIFLSSPTLPGVTVETARRFIIYNLLLCCFKCAFQEWKSKIIS